MNMADSPYRRYNHKRLNDRTIDEMIGLSRGILADNIINKEEAAFLKSWMEANIAYCNDPIINNLYCRIHEMLIDDIIDNDEQAELIDLMRNFTGETTAGHHEKLATTLPLSKPTPRVEFPSCRFCLTGKFAYGPRRICEEVIIERGGTVISGITYELDYLVIGTLCSPDWVHTAYGRKIEKAVQYQKNKVDLSIITEDTWVQTAFAM